MQRSRIMWFGVGVMAVLAVAGTVAQQNAPGLPTRADVHVMNRDRSEAVPVVIVGTAAPSVPVNVSVVGTPMVELAPNTVVNTRRSRQGWEYRQIVVSAGADPSPALNAAGNDGWEAVGASSAPGGGAIWVMKRPR